MKQNLIEILNKREKTIVKLLKLLSGIENINAEENEKEFMRLVENKDNELKILEKLTYDLNVLLKQSNAALLNKVEEQIKKQENDFKVYIEQDFNLMQKMKKKLFNVQKKLKDKKMHKKIFNAYKAY